MDILDNPARQRPPYSVIPIVLKPLRPLAAVALAGSVVSCGDDPVRPDAVTAVVSLASGADTVLAGSSIAGVVQFPQAPSGGAEYLLVGQFATANPTVSSSVRLGGAASVATHVAPLTQLAAGGDPASRFHRELRVREAEFAVGAQRLPASVRAAPRSGAAVPPTVGSTRTFRVCANLDCDSLVNVVATAQVVGTHLAIYVDNAAPANGFSTADLQQLGNQFDADLYSISVNAFGSESDVDANGVVVVLLTPRVNRLVTSPQCSTSFVTGYFYGADLAPGVRQNYNNGEVFYGMVPDPNGTVSCSYSVSFTKRILQTTFVHEFQHMISFNQHVLVRNSLTEVLWLNEGLSHLAEELAGLYYDSLGVDSNATRFLIGNLYDAFVYLREPHRHALVTEEPPGSLQERGAAWLFTRFIVDQGSATTTRQLVQTALTGADNVEAALGAGFENLLARWAFALWVTDLPGFNAAPTRRYDFWRFRTTFASLNQQDPQDFPVPFPLTPASGQGSQAAVSATVTAGSGVYLRVTQAPGGPAFAMSFRNASGAALPAGSGAQLAVIRIR